MEDGVGNNRAVRIMEGEETGGGRGGRWACCAQTKPYLVAQC